MGRPAKPLKIHQLEGTFKRERHVKKNIGGGRLPMMPRGMDATARAMWRHVIATRSDWLAESDAAALQQLCVTWSLWRKTEKLVQKNPTDKDTRCSHVAYQQECKRLFACFGMNPSDRAKLGEQTESEYDPAADFIA